MFARPLAALALAAGLLAACGSDDDATDAAASDDPADAATGDDRPLPEITECTFTPTPPEDADGIIAGSVTVRGENTTGEAIDTTSIRYEVEGVDGDLGVSVSFWQPDEPIELTGGVFSDADPADLAAGECTSVEVRPADYGEMTEFDAEAATCEIQADAGDAAREGTFEVDVSQVADLPDDEQLFATVAVRDGDTRVDEQFPYVEPGETTGEGSLGLGAAGDDLSCEVMNLRLP